MTSKNRLLARALACAVLVSACGVTASATAQVLVVAGGGGGSGGSTSGGGAAGAGQTGTSGAAGTGTAGGAGGTSGSGGAGGTYIRYNGGGGAGYLANGAAGSGGGSGLGGATGPSYAGAAANGAGAGGAGGFGGGGGGGQSGGGGGGGYSGGGGGAGSSLDGGGGGGSYIASSLNTVSTSGTNGVYDGSGRAGSNGYVTFTLAGGATTRFDYTGGSQTYTLTNSGVYDIVVAGAQGGGITTSTGVGGYGAVMEASQSFDAGSVFDIIVGGAGAGATGSHAAGGGGGSFVIETVVGVSTAPEPATWALGILGFGFAGGVLRRKRRRESDYIAALAA